MRVVRIGEHQVGGGHPPFFVAELGICHEGSLAVALELAEAAAAAGAHCVKTEAFQRSRLVYDPSAVASFCIRGKRITMPLAELMDRYQLSLEEHHAIKRRCDELGLPFMCTAHDFQAVDFLAEIGAAAVKIASPDIVHLPLLRHAAGKGLPVFLDTGAALQWEVERAVACLGGAGLKDIVVNHNPAGHPAPAEGHDLRIMGRLRRALELPVGLADHYEGYEMAWAAAAAGADTVEKPISRDRFVEEPERNYSVSVEDLPAFLATLADFHAALGRPRRTLSAAQEEYRDNNRLACVAARDLAAGESLDLAGVTFGRPRLGIPVELWDQVEGRRLRRAKRAGEFLEWGDLA
jgi:sialic acid synthase SpsE